MWLWIFSRITAFNCLQQSVCVFGIFASPVFGRGGNIYIFLNIFIDFYTYFFSSMSTCLFLISNMLWLNVSFLDDLANLSWFVREISTRRSESTESRGNLQFLWKLTNLPILQLNNKNRARQGDYRECVEGPNACVHRQHSQGQNGRADQGGNGEK